MLWTESMEFVVSVFFLLLFFIIIIHSCNTVCSTGDGSVQSFIALFRYVKRLLYFVCDVRTYVHTKQYKCPLNIDCDWYLASRLKFVLPFFLRLCTFEKVRKKPLARLPFLSLVKHDKFFFALYSSTCICMHGFNAHSYERVYVCVKVWSFFIFFCSLSLLSFCIKFQLKIIRRWFFFLKKIKQWQLCECNSELIIDTKRLIFFLPCILFVAANRKWREFWK